MIFLYHISDIFHHPFHKAISEDSFVLFGFLCQDDLFKDSLLCFRSTMSSHEELGMNVGLFAWIVVISRDANLSAVKNLVVSLVSSA